MTQFANPAQAYKAGYALEDADGWFRYVTETGLGTMYRVPDDVVVDTEVLIESAGFGPIRGAPLADVEPIAAERRKLS